MVEYVILNPKLKKKKKGGIGLESIFSSKKIQLDKFSLKGNDSIVAGTSAYISKEKN